MILIDYNGVAIGSVITQNLEIDENFVRHTILNSIRAINKRFGSKYGDIVIACDSRSWRRNSSLLRISHPRLFMGSCT